MSHYLTQPEEIDYILMTEEQDAQAGMQLATPFNQNTLNNSNLARTIQNHLPVINWQAID